MVYDCEILCYNKKMDGTLIKLFHGSKRGLDGKIRPISRELCDFGKGFYMGTEKTQPMTLIYNYENATMYELELNIENLTVKDIPLNLDWAMFVAFNRGRLTNDIAPELYRKFESFKTELMFLKDILQMIECSLF